MRGLMISLFLVPRNWFGNHELGNQVWDPRCLWVWKTGRLWAWEPGSLEAWEPVSLGALKSLGVLEPRSMQAYKNVSEPVLPKLDRTVFTLVDSDFVRWCPILLLVWRCGYFEENLSRRTWTCARSAPERSYCNYYL